MRRFLPVAAVAAAAALIAAGHLFADVCDPTPVEDFTRAHNGMITGLAKFVDVRDDSDEAFELARDGLQDACDASTEVRWEHPNMAHPIARYLAETEMALRYYMLLLTADRAGVERFASDTSIDAISWSIKVNDRRIDATAQWLVEAQDKGCGGTIEAALKG